MTRTHVLCVRHQVHPTGPELKDDVPNRMRSDRIRQTREDGWLKSLCVDLEYVHLPTLDIVLDEIIQSHRWDLNDLTPLLFVQSALPLDGHIPLLHPPHVVLPYVIASPTGGVKRQNLARFWPSRLLVRDQPRLNIGGLLVDPPFSFHHPFVRLGAGLEAMCLKSNLSSVYTVKRAVYADFNGNKGTARCLSRNSFFLCPLEKGIPQIKGPLVQEFFADESSFACPDRATPNACSCRRRKRSCDFIRQWVAVLQNDGKHTNSYIEYEDGGRWG
mmetsp:Transcript_3016/g.6492  ORF Transcript_3016/g.6492 Transcript_3016/m.6492 type:complete len:273 (-) Transcript_3016:135-953(-)